MTSFISYAQNFEDVMLWRALRGVQSGFYIDIGAHDPVTHSVTKAFYERGWQGINIEPVQHWYQRIIEDRPRDINLQLAASSQNGTILFYEVEGTGLSTIQSSVAKQYQLNGAEVLEYDIQVRRLDDICDQYNVSEIHFLKIDVEGHEAEVLAGINLDKTRPWIIVVESTEPNSQVSTHHLWEHLITSHDYKFVYFDGLNRFYMAEEHQVMAEAFSAPPNVFDDFIQINLHELRDVRNRLNDIYNSWPWRLSRPLRWIRNLYVKLFFNRC